MINKKKDKARQKRKRRAEKRRQDAVKSGQTLEEPKGPTVTIERRELPDLDAHEALGRMPPFEARYSGTEVLENAVRSIQNMARRQGRTLNVGEINPFDAEPCAGAVMVETVRELKGVRKDLADFAEVAAEGLELSGAQIVEIAQTVDGFAARLEAIEKHLGIVVDEPSDEEEGDVGST